MICLSLDWKEHLSDFSVYEVIELHRMGLITREEIIESERHLSEFGDILKEYLDYEKSA